MEAGTSARSSASEIATFGPITFRHRLILLLLPITHLITKFLHPRKKKNCNKMSSSVVPLAPVKITALADAANLSADSIHNLAAVLAVLDYKTDSYDQGLPKWIACANTLGNGFASKSKDLSKALLEVGAWLDFFVECKGGQRNLVGIIFKNCHTCRNV